MSVLAILEELAQELVHQQGLWSESLLFSDEERQAAAASECRLLSDVLQDVHRHLMDLRRVGLPSLPSYGETVSIEVSSSSCCWCRHHEY